MSRAFFDPRGPQPSRSTPIPAYALWIGLGLGALGAACSSTIPPDPYMGTIDPGAFDPLVAFSTSTSNPVAACVQPRRGFGGGTAGLDGLTWIYLGGLSATQLDIANASDPTKALPAAAYQVSGCNAPEGRADAETFDPRVDNYVKDKQFPVLSQGLMPALAGTITEPTRLSTYKPWHVVVPTALGPSLVDRMGCNDIKGERSLLERAGWSRETKMFPEGGPRDFTISFPSRDAIRAGMATFKDWPMISVAAPVMSTPDGLASCPFVTGTTARYPAFPGDPAASFQFPSQHWLRGLLGGYLDGGDLPVTTDPTACSSIPVTVATGRTCTAATDCNAAAKETCPSGMCLAPLPICPVLNDLYVAKDEVPVPSTTTAANPIASATVTLKDPADMTKTRTADILAIFSATPGQPGFSPVCRLRFFDKTKVNCGRTEPDAIAPRPLCTPQEIQASPGAVMTTPRDYYVHCLFLQNKSR